MSKEIASVTWVKDASVQFTADLATKEGVQEEPMLYDTILHAYVRYTDGTDAEFGTADNDVTDAEALDAIDAAWKACFPERS